MKKIDKLYTYLTVNERLKLFLAAIAEGQDKEAEKLLVTQVETVRRLALKVLTLTVISQEFYTHVNKRVLLKEALIHFDKICQLSLAEPITSTHKAFLEKASVLIAGQIKSLDDSVRLSIAGFRQFCKAHDFDASHLTQLAGSSEVLALLEGEMVDPDQLDCSTMEREKQSYARKWAAVSEC